MSNYLGEELKKILLAGIGAAALTAEKTKELIDELVKKGELTWEQGKVLNEELKRNIKTTIKENCTVRTIDPELLSPEQLDELKRKLAAMEEKEQQEKEQQEKEQQAQENLKEQGDGAAE